MTVAAWLLFLSGVGIGVVLSILLTAPAYRKQAASIRKLIAESDANIAETARIKQRFEEWHKRQALPEALQQVVDSLFVNGSGEQAARLVLTSKDGRDLGGWAKGPILDRLMAATRTQAHPTPTKDAKK